MKVRRERPSQRLNHRVNAPVRIEMPEGVFQAVDWSLGGFRIKGYAGGSSPSDEIAVTVHIPFQGFDLSFPVEAKVIRVTEDGELGAAFGSLGGREREIMSHFIDELVRGSMTSTDDVILRIDTPVTPVSTEPDPNPIEEVPVRRWPIKQIAIPGFYLFAGVLVAGYAYTVFNANFLRMEVSSAMVTAPIEPILATADGKLVLVNANPGETLQANTALFVIENAKIEERIEMAKIKVERETMELVARQKDLEVERAKAVDYRTMMLTKLEQASAKVRALERQHTLVGSRVNRLRKLKAKGLTTRTKVEEIAAQYAIIKGQFEEALAQKRENQIFLQSVKEGRVVDGNKINSRHLELQTEVDHAWDKIMLAKDELMALQRHKERLTLAAPSNGRVIKIFKGRGSSVKSGESIGLFERAEARRIRAYLTQAEVLQVGLGDIALVFFPALNQSTRAVIVGIDRTGGVR